MISNIHLQLQHTLSSHAISSMCVAMCVCCIHLTNMFIFYFRIIVIFMHLHLICKVMTIPILVMFVLVVRTHTRVTFKVFLCTFSQKSHKYGF